MDLISPKPDLLVVFTDAIKCKVGREFLAYMSKKINKFNYTRFSFTIILHESMLSFKKRRKRQLTLLLQ